VELSPSEARAVVKRARHLRDEIGRALAESAQREHAAREAYESARDEIVDRQLAAMSIEKLRETTEGGVRFGAIKAAGFTTVESILQASPNRLMQIRGVGQHTAMQVLAAARQLELAMKEGLWLRFDLERKPKEQKRLLEALASYGVAREALAPVEAEVEPLVDSIDELSKKARKSTSRVRMFFARSRKREEAQRAAAQLEALLDSPSTSVVERGVGEALPKLHDRTKPDDPWGAYEARAASFNGLLIDVGGLSLDEGAAQGFVPDELASRVHEQQIDTSLLKVSLRGYQAFGAKFALLQRHALLGDEMGLGKTIEALAVMANLRAKGSKYFLVVCPASVLVNWLHEVERHSELTGVRLHGMDRETNLKLWVRNGGVGVTTFGSLRWLAERDPDVRPALLVVDEAHYVKNPRAQRTRDVLDWIPDCKRTLFLTGTPMENRVDEFRTLVRHLQPQLAVGVNAVDGLVGAAAFRKVVSPVYLRRNQTDVLQELPPRIETEEWVVLTGDDFTAYRDAVAEGNFMTMRQAAYASAARSGSSKLSRLLDIVEEATANDRKVVIFSFFRRVLETIAGALDDLAMGPITGSVPPAKRQQLVDDFSAARTARALVSQIDAGGVGLNIQAASVVLLAEPQWKPSTEEQAIARCHRMGQARPVDVHRLLAEDSVDQRMLEVLATKALLFDEYVRRSELKEISPDAVDISDVQTAKEVVSVAEEERRIVEAERKRLGLEAEVGSTG
jgi:SNF2 family DNA or RNA helicase